jgi:DNA-binding NtrC family response regulator
MKEFIYDVGVSYKEAVNAFKKEYILATIDYTNGDQTKAAKILDIQRPYLSRLKRTFNLKMNPYTKGE